MISALYILHYGKTWLHWSMRSVRDFVDEVYVFYTSTPSHGHQTVLHNPETREELYEISMGHHAVWHDCPAFRNEGEHRTYAMEICKKAGSDLVLVVDADEIWHPEVLSRALTFVKSEQMSQSYRVGMRHFWRSLKWICDDEAMPTRFVKPCATGGIGYLDPVRIGKAFHMGYAQPPSIIEYKQSIHGHKGEWRNGWFEQKFLPWNPLIRDVHPTCVDYWNPKPYKDNGELEYLVGDSPYFGMDIIR